MKSFFGLFSGLNLAITGNGFRLELVRNGIGSLILKAFDVLSLFLITVMLARALGANGYGVYAYVYALVSLLIIPAEFGLPSLLVRETAKALAKQEWGKMQGVWRWAGKITGILTALWGIIGAAIASTVTQIVWNILLWLAVRRRLKINSMAFDLFGKV